MFEFASKSINITSAKSVFVRFKPNVDYHASSLKIVDKIYMGLLVQKDKKETVKV